MRTEHGFHDCIMKHFIRRILAIVSAFMKSKDRSYTYYELIRQGDITVGRHTYGMPHVMNYPGSKRKVRIGSFCSIAAGVKIVTGGIHPLEWVSTYPFRIKWDMDGAYCDGMPTTRGDVVIGNDVWIGIDVTILSGVNIGNGSVIGACSVVTRDIPPYAIAVGSPARVVRYRFSAEQIAELLNVAWWNWDDQRIREAVPYLSSGGVDKFLAYAKTGRKE